MAEEKERNSKGLPSFDGSKSQKWEIFKKKCRGVFVKHSIAEYFDEQMKANGLKRLFLHAASIEFIHPLTEQRMKVEAPLEPALQQILKKLV